MLAFIVGDDCMKFCINWDASTESSAGGRGNTGFVPIQGDPVSVCDNKSH